MKDYILIQEADFQKARNRIKQAQKEGKAVVFSGDDEMNRKVLEKENVNILLIKLGKRKDRLKQRNSGLNHVLAKLAQKKGVSIGMDFDEFINADKKEKTKILARLIQNIKLCNKNRLKMIFVSEKYEKDRHDLRALGLVLGMPTWMTKDL
mgnify:CR=1 FL=1